MITGFEEQTHDLTEYELTLVPLMVSGLKTKHGKENAITSNEMIKALEKRGHKVNGARIRKLINHIRINHLIPRLLSNSKGYFVSDDQQEMKDYLDSLAERISAIQAVRDALAKDYYEHGEHQLNFL